MDPIIENDWLGPKQEPVEETQNVPNLTRSWLGREMDIEPLRGPVNKTVLENMAEDILVQKTLTSRCCDLPGYPRSTFLMVFSPDGTKVASTHGNHNVYVSELASGKHVRILKGHPRTPWCIAFHPSHPQLIGSGCLGGQVRVWDLSGGSEVWTVSNETVIASMAFHPRDQLLVIATFNELYFWDWSQPAPLTKVCTRNTNEKVRYVAFDSLGYKLITGISSVWGLNTSSNTTAQNTPSNQSSPNTNNQSPGGGGDQRPDQPGDRASQPRSLDHRFNHDIVFNSYHNLVQRYDSLVRNYRRLFLARHRLSSSPVNTTDRGTDPMETDTSLRNGHSSRAFRPWAPSDEGSSRPQNYVEIVDYEASSSRSLSLDVLSINGDPTRSVDSNDITDNESSFASRTSAFQRFSDELELLGDADPDPPPRLLPNPFSTSVTAPRLATDGSSRTTVFTSRRLDSPSARYFLQRRRRNAAAQNTQTSTSTSTNTLPQDDELSRSLFLESRRRANSRSGSTRPTTANSSTQLSPAAEQTINESLDLIRDILRDSGTRLLNLITNMSLSTLASVERSIPRRQRSSVTESDARRDLLISESDTDSDHSAQDSSRTSSAQDEGTRSAHLSHDHPYHSTRHLLVDLNGDLHSDEAVANEPNRPSVSTSPGRFRVRSHSTEENPSRENNTTNENEGQGADESQPSTSRDTSWMDDAFRMGPVMLPSEAISKVKTGVSMLHRHTTQLTEIWLRGTPMSMAELRNTWEDLRRRIVALNRSNNPTEVHSRYFTRNLIDRCRFVADRLRNRHRNMHMNNEMRSRENVRERSNRERSRDTNTDNQQAPTSTDSTSSSIATDVEEPSRSELRASFCRLVNRARVRRRGQEDGEGRRRPRPRPPRAPHTPRASLHRCLLHSHRLARRDLTRSFEVHCTRHEIRMRAMQVLSIMFNMMMSCLERRALSQIIIHMLKTLKKALALSCLMLVTHRLTRRTNETQTRAERAAAEEEGGAAEAEPGSSGQSRQEENDAAARANRLNVLNNITRQQFTDHNADSTSSWPEFSDSEDEDVPRNKKMKVDPDAASNERKENESSSSTAGPSQPPRLTAAAQRWSNRLAVQISAANRNTSLTARRRHAFYVETRRLKALHRTNPMVHPITRRKIKPPISTHRIPVVRRLPPSAKKPKTKTTESNRPASFIIEEPVAGPSNSQPGPSGDSNSPREGTSREVMNDFEHRVNLVRIAHMHAVRMRNAARNRFRRLQTIRLYTPSAVREMFALQSNNNDLPNATDNQYQPTLNNASDVMYPASFGLYRPHILTTRNDDTGNRAEGNRPYDYVIPMVEEGAPANEAQNGQPQRLPRIQEYLQPIILAQNALVVEEGGGGGGLGHIHLDSGPLHEALPPSAHRVQAWDFSTGSTPDIADSTKNIVVPRCRIHNDASIDISKDGKLLVALLPVPRFRNGHDVLGIYSLEWGRLGQCLHTAILEQSAVSVALSPTARHLAVGLGSRRFTTLPHARNNVFALLYNLTGHKKTSRHGLTPVKELEQNWEQGFTSLNCLRWAPQPGQGLVYANNTGQLIVMS